MSLPPVEVPAGAMRFNSDSQKLEYWDGSQWLQVSTFSPNLNGGARGVFFGSVVAPSVPNYADSIDYINIASTGNSSSFGVLSSIRGYATSFASSTRGLCAGGANPTFTNTIEYVTISSTGTVSTFGQLLVNPGLYECGGCSNSTRGLIGGGYTPGSVTTNAITYVTIASTGNSVSFGQLTRTDHYGITSTCASPTRGVWAGGGATAVNTIDYVTIATLGNATSFGQLSTSRITAAGCSSATRGLFAGGYNPTVLNSIEYITIASLGNAVNFGQLTAARSYISGCSSSTRGVFGGGQAPTKTNVIDYVNIATQGNAVSFGILTSQRYGTAACSNAHGGL